jgi:tRNA pseudouridine55 synthase
MTRLSQWLTGGDKEYEATLRLGASSDTDDALGQITPVPVAVPSCAVIEDRLAAFRGWIDQVPPDHSAVKVGGVRSYRRARRKEPTRLTARRVRIDRLDIVGYEPPRVRVEVECGKGTYIRALARDLGETLGCGGYVEQLRRVRVGRMTVADAVELADLQDEDVRAKFVPPRRALQDVLEFVEVGSDAAEVFSHGGAVPAGAELGPGQLAVFQGERLLGVGRMAADGLLRPAMVLAEPVAG